MIIVTLAEKRPDLLEEWDYEKNNPLGLDPTKIRYGTHSKAWWKCNNNHLWFQDVSSRSIKGHSCVKCYMIKRKEQGSFKSGKLLRDYSPELFKELHPSLNSYVDLDTLSYGSKKNVWWTCSNGHDYQATPNKRTSMGRGCPFCSGQKVNASNCLEAVNPTLAKEWHKEKNGAKTPSNTSGGSNYLAWWIGLCGHTWKSSVKDRNGKNTGCPKCHGKIIDSDNSLARKYPNLLKEWHYDRNLISPHNVAPKSSKKVWWVCTHCTNEWESNISSRTQMNSGCPKCAQWRQTSYPEQAIYFYIAKVFSDALNNSAIDIQGISYSIDVLVPNLLAVEYDGYRHGSRKRVSNDMRKDNALTDYGIHVIRIREHTLPVLASTTKTIIRTQSNTQSSLTESLNELFQYLLIEGYIQLQNMPTVDLEKDHFAILSATINCDIENSFAIRQPALLMEWHREKNHPVDPFRVSHGSSQTFWWICHICQHEWQTKVQVRTKGSGCPICAKHVRAKSASQKLIKHGRYSKYNG